MQRKDLGWVETTNQLPFPPAAFMNSHSNVTGRNAEFRVGTPAPRPNRIETFKEYSAVFVNVSTVFMQCIRLLYSSV